MKYDEIETTKPANTLDVQNSNHYPQDFAPKAFFGGEVKMPSTGFQPSSPQTRNPLATRLKS